METIKMTEAQRKSRRQRNIALGVVLFCLAVLFYVMTWAKMGGFNG